MDRIAVLGEQASTVDVVVAAFKCQGVEVSRIAHCDEVTATLSDKPYLLVIFCLAEVDGAGVGAVSRLLAAFPDTPIVLAAATLSLDLAHRAIRLGAFDLLILPHAEETINALLIRARLHRRDMILRRLAAIAQFSGWFAHEVRNPLSGILNSAQLLIGGSTSPDLPPRYLKLIVQEGERIEQFLRCVTEFGRFHRGPAIPAALNAVATRAVSRATPRLQRQSIQLEQDFDPQVPEVRMDVLRVELAISRLIANAAEAMPTGGVMTVGTRHRPDEGVIEVEVTDTDLKTGLERERQLLGRFEPSRFKEDGLGLALALQTFAEHGGDISFRVLSDQGCSIVARLPLNGR